MNFVMKLLTVFAVIIFSFLEIVWIARTLNFSGLVLIARIVSDVLISQKKNIVFLTNNSQKKNTHVV